MDVLKLSSHANNFKICMIFLCKLLVAFNETPLCEGVADNYIGVVFQDLFGKSVTESYSSLSAICTPAILTVDNPVTQMEDTETNSASI